jgi:hypothetical protein
MNRKLRLKAINKLKEAMGISKLEALIILENLSEEVKGDYSNGNV